MSHLPALGGRFFTTDPPGKPMLVLLVLYKLFTRPLCQLASCCSVAQSCLTLYNPMDCSTPGSLYFTISWSLLKLTTIESVMLSNHLILCCPLILLPSIFSSIRVFSNELALHIRWPKYWSFSFSISPSKEYSGLISFRIDWLDLFDVQGTLYVNEIFITQTHTLLFFYTNGLFFIYLFFLVKILP